MNVNVKQQTMSISQSNVNQLPGKENPPGRKCSKWSLAKRFIVGLLAIMLCIFSHAQEVMKIGSYTEVERQYKKYIDLVLPTEDTLPFGWIYLEARGADGGRRNYNDHKFDNKHYANGGEGATLGGWVKIEDDAQGCIPFGSTIRFIIGQKGESCNSWTLFATGGGGGTGILFLPPNAVNGEWQHLIIAGGGGGSYASALSEWNGGGGRAYADCTSGEASTGSNHGNAAGWKYGTSGAEPGWRPNYGDWADWVKVDGKFKAISIGLADSSIWGIDTFNRLCRMRYDDSKFEAYNTDSITWKQVSAVDWGTSWGISSDNKIYRLKDDIDPEEMVHSILLKQISVASDSTAWGVNTNNEIYRRKDDDSNWERIPGSLVQISHGSDNDVWGVNSEDKIYRRKAGNSDWQNISGALRQISVATDGTVWGVNVKGEIYRRKDDDSGWIKMISNNNVVFKVVSAGSSTNIWALDKNGDIYYCNGASDSGPGPIGGKGTSGSNGKNGGWGYGGGGAGYDDLGGSGGGSGGGSCGGQVHMGYGGGGGYSWINEEYISKEFQVIRKNGRSGGGDRHHTSNGCAKYEISDSNSGSPFTPWVKVDGKFKDISVADDGTVWGVNKNNEIYRRKADDSAWEMVPDLWTPNMCIVQLSHGSYSEDVWGVNSNNEIYHRKDDNSYWGKVPGLLKQVSVAADGTVWGVNIKNE
ncbi:MAG: hypothetical protein GY746_11560, partial [Gammaproteobacteria bacterium]|nr:hypothetical protein [Gammaproteobacteria bacterium]